MFNTERMSEAICIPAVGIRSASVGTGTTLTSAINLAKLRRVMFIVDVGAIGTSGTVDFKVQGATTSGGTYADIANTSIVQITTSNNYAIVEITAEQIQALGLGYQYLKGKLVIGTAASQVDVIVLGGVGRFEPNSNQNDASVATPIVL